MYRYTVVNDRTVLVYPGTYRIVEVIDLIRIDALRRRILEGSYLRGFPIKVMQLLGIEVEISNGKLTCSCCCEPKPHLLGRGDKIVEVANALEISYKTVANTTLLLKQKLGAKNHSDLIRIAVEMGLD